MHCKQSGSIRQVAMVALTHLKEEFIMIFEHCVNSVKKKSSNGFKKLVVKTLSLLFPKKLSHSLHFCMWCLFVCLFQCACLVAKRYLLLRSRARKLTALSWIETILMINTLRQKLSIPTWKGCRRKGYKSPKRLNLLNYIDATLKITYNDSNYLFKAAA